MTLAKTLWLLGISAPYVAVGALLVSLIAVALLLNVRARLKKLGLGRTGSLEETIQILARDMKEQQTFRKELEKYLKLSETRLRGSVQGVGVVRFNPFSGDGSGGNQSFAAAFIDESASGVVFSTLYARDRVGVYAKPLENGASTFELTAEEKQAIEKAKMSVAGHKK
jgi:hypothetical protein